MFVNRKTWCAFFSSYLGLEIRPFALLLMNFQYGMHCNHKEKKEIAKMRQ